MDKHRHLALVLTGGGARAAYQVGLLRCLGRHMPDLRPQIITGVSAGAINASFLATHQGTLAEAAEGLRALWENLEAKDVFRIDMRSMAGSAARWALRMSSGGSQLGKQVHGLLDTSPLRALLERALETNDAGKLLGVEKNLAAGRLSAVALATVNYSTGQTVNWIQTDGGHPPWQRPDRRAEAARLTVDHVMASSSLPLIFPAVELDGCWYGDGGIRQAAPVSPALHLGATRVLAVSTRYGRSQREADEPTALGRPQPAQIFGNLMNAIFLDVLDRDVQRLERLNSLIRKLPEEEREGLRLIDLMLLRPSVDLGKLSADYELRMPGTLRYLTRSLGSRQSKSPDFLSMLMFQPDYLQRLMEIGEADAEARLDELRALLMD